MKFEFSISHKIALIRSGQSRRVSGSVE